MRGIIAFALGFCLLAAILTAADEGIKPTIDRIWYGPKGAPKTDAGTP